ncbi:MAG TPA: TetR/AcrR family transcriptional regulator [Terriglobales bacterium]|nr:TetR/AcrR family transcriptional regulator [Terriglobales bacterium]
MSRPPDPDLENRILNAAQKLWKKEGAKALTMRAVARAADTNTPAVYRRFRDRRDIVRALVRRTQMEVGRVLEPCPTVEKAVAAYLEYGLSHPHEYELFYQHLQEISGSASSRDGASLKELRPNFGLMERKLAEELGGTPEEHRRLGLALWALAHGTAALLLLRAVPPGEEAALRAGFTAAVGTLLRAALPDSSSVRKSM